MLSKKCMCWCFIHYWFCKFKCMSPLLFCDVMQHMLVVVYWCCGRPAGSIFNCQDCWTLEDGADRLLQNVVNSYWRTQCNITEQQRSQLNLSRNSHRRHDLWVPLDVHLQICVVCHQLQSKFFGCSVNLLHCCCPTHWDIFIIYLLANTFKVHLEPASVVICLPLGKCEKSC